MRFIRYTLATVAFAGSVNNCDTSKVLDLQFEYPVIPGALDVPRYIEPVAKVQERKVGYDTCVSYGYFPLED